MIYTTPKTLASLHFVRIEPLDARMVTLRLSVKSRDYKTRYSDVQLSLYADLLLSGTETHSKKEIDSFLKKHGLKLMVGASEGCVHITVLARFDRIHYALQILDELIYTPAFDPTEFKNKVNVMREENREGRDDAKRIATIHFRNLLYPQNPYMRRATLDEEYSELTSVRRGILATLKMDVIHGEWFVTLVGTQSVEAALQPLLTKLSKNSTPTSREVHSDSIQKSASKYVTIPGKTNVEVRLGNVLPVTPLDDDYIPFEFGLAVLGKVGGFSGRLMSTVREKEGLTYGIYATVIETHKTNTGFWQIYTFFTGKDLARGLTSTMRELTHIVEKGITPDELGIFKEILANQYLIAHGSNSGRAAFYHTALLRGESEVDMQRYFDEVQNLTAQRVNEALRKYIDPKKLIISAAGPVTTSGKGISQK